MKRIYTAVFRPWHTPYAWFSRDSGLVTEGLRRIGVESRLVIMDTPGMDQDERFLPATREQFTSSNFWRSLKLDTVVLQGGGDAGIDPVSRAIKDSGAKLFLRLDTDGVVAPQVDPYLYCYNLWWWLAYHHRHPAIILALAKATMKTLLPVRFGPGRIVNRLKLGDRLLVESRVAGARLQRLLAAFASLEVAMRVIHLPIPAADEWCYKPDVPKEDLIVSVARWYDAQKDAKKLIRVLARVLAMHPKFSAIIIGDGDDFLNQLIQRHALSVAHRIHVTGRMAHERIPEHERRAKIFLCTSRAESMSIASAEALCCGCSVVGPAEIASMHEYTSTESGTLAWTRRTSDFADAVSAEIAGWSTGRRDPSAISSRFRRMLSCEAIAGSLCELLESKTATNARSF